MPTLPEHSAPRRPRLRARLALWAALAAALALGGCNLNYLEGQTREQQNRWEEAAIQYHLAVIDSPGDAEYRKAYVRARHQVAVDNIQRYKTYLANKEFTKAYLRLIDASRQDPDLPEVKAELAKWTRVLVCGQVNLDFTTPQAVTSVADEIRLVVHINTPNPGEVLEAEIDVDTGIFFAENLLYDRPDELLTYYSINAIGLNLVQGRTRVKQFTSHEFVRFVNFRTPVLDGSLGSVTFPSAGPLEAVVDQRGKLPPETWPAQMWVPRPNPKYRMVLQGNRILVSSPDGRSDFTPRFLYINKQDRRMLVDFGRYEVRLDEESRRWGLRRLSLSQKDYFPPLSKNVALEPYFFYRDTVVAYQPAGAG